MIPGKYWNSELRCNSLVKYRQSGALSINVILRGHLRDAFQSAGMLFFIQQLKKHSEVNLYVHTWDTAESSTSWRRVNEKKIKLDDPILSLPYVVAYKRESEVNYFKHAPQYSPDSKISDSKMPTRGWRQYIYALQQSANMVVADDNTRTLSMRVDFFDGCFACKDIAFDISVLVTKILHADIAKIVLLTHDIGCDNMILSTASNLKWLFNAMIDDFERIRDGVNARTVHQEVIVRDFIKQNNLLSAETLGQHDIKDVLLQKGKTLLIK